MSCYRTGCEVSLTNCRSGFFLFNRYIFILKIICIPYRRWDWGGREFDCFLAVLSVCTVFGIGVLVSGMLTIYPPLPRVVIFFLKAALEEERRLVARVVHLMRNDDTDRYFRMLVVARRHLGQVGLLW